MSHGNISNPIFWKKVLGRKRLGEQLLNKQVQICGSNGLAIDLNDGYYHEKQDTNDNPSLEKNWINDLSVHCIDQC